jgi:hypothetical protein
MPNNRLHWTFCFAGAAQNPSEPGRYASEQKSGLQKKARLNEESK